MHPIELQHDVGHVESHFGTFGCKVGARFAPKIPKAQKSFWTHSMVLLCDEAQLEACFGQFRDSASLDATFIHGLHQAYHRLENYFGCTQWNSSVTWVMRNLFLVHLNARWVHGLRKM
jgi:hypothetical protein